MALNLKNPQVERLVAEIAEMTGETKTEAVRKALEERKQRLAFQVVGSRPIEVVHRFLEREVWSLVPEELLGKPLKPGEQDEILGFGPEGM